MGTKPEFITWENSRHFATHCWFAREITSEMKFHTDDRSLYPRLHSASDWSCHEGNLLQPIRSTILQIWLVTHHQSRFTNIFRGKTNVCATKCRLFSYVKIRWIAQEVMIGPFFRILINFFISWMMQGNLIELEVTVDHPCLTRDLGSRGVTPIHYLYGYVPPNGVVILKLLI